MRGRKKDGSEFEWPPTGLFVEQVGRYYSRPRRPTPAELETVRELYPGYCEYTRELAAGLAASADGLTEAEWATRPAEYLGRCDKECYANTRMAKGAVEEFGAWGVYVCTGCGYAYPPGCFPKAVGRAGPEDPSP